MDFRQVQLDTKLKTLTTLAQYNDEKQHFALKNDLLQLRNEFESLPKLDAVMAELQET